MRGTMWHLLLPAGGWFSVCASEETAFASVAEALRVGDALAAYLNSPAVQDLDGPARGAALERLGVMASRLGAAYNGMLRRFDADYGHDADGYGTAAAWLAAKTRLRPNDARAAVKQMNLLRRHPLLDQATTTGDLTVSWARQLADWTRRIDDEDLQAQADQVLLGAAKAGADLDDLHLIAQAAYEAWRAQEPDPEEDPRGKGFADRYLQLDTTFERAGRLTGDLTPECAAAVLAVLESLGKRRGPEDLRTTAQRYHDALQEGCELLLRAKLVPDRAGADSRVDVHIGLRDLRNMDGAPAVEEAWLRARSGQHGYLQGADAETVACDSLIVPIVTGSPDWDRINQMIALVTAAYPPAPWTGPGGPDGRDGRTGPDGRQRPLPLPPHAMQALQYGLARLAIDFVSGPGALASALRRGLLGAPLNTRSLPLDVGYSDTIPTAIRRAVILRDAHCAWPGGCDKRPAACDVHHLKHKKDGGPTSAKDCILLCQYHHDICVHRNHWNLELLPDGSTRATSPDGQVIRSHAPPPPAAPPGAPSPASPQPSG